MADVILITGGVRSGKSSFAQRLAESRAERRIYVATCPIIDDELARRVARHRDERRHRNWETVEETLDIEGVLRRFNGDEAVLVDCLTLWVNNLLHAEERGGLPMDEEAIAILGQGIAAAAGARRGPTVFVTNEVGMGIIPADTLSRRFGDLLGRGNQVIAAAADTVILMVGGMPLYLKGKS